MTARCLQLSELRREAVWQNQNEPRTASGRLTPRSTSCADGYDRRIGRPIKGFSPRLEHYTHDSRRKAPGPGVTVLAGGYREAFGGRMLRGGRMITATRPRKATVRMKST